MTYSRVRRGLARAEAAADGKHPLFLTARTARDIVSVTFADARPLPGSQRLYTAFIPSPADLGEGMGE
jgi:hypothetical protein